MLCSDILPQSFFYSIQYFEPAVQVQNWCLCCVLFLFAFQSFVVYVKQY